MAREEISKQIGIPAFVAGKVLAQAARYRNEELIRAITACVDAECGIKTGQLKDVLAVETLIVRLGEM